MSDQTKSSYDKMRILVSNGSNQFHLAPLSAELSKRGCLAGMITSGWPTPMTAAVAKLFQDNPAVRRFLARGHPIPADKLYATNVAELIFQGCMRARRISEHTEQRLARSAFAWYTAYARRVLRRVKPDLYHYRACYGLGSVPVARELGCINLCDHSIAHPGVLQYMVENEGRWPATLQPNPASPLQRLMWRDIHQADAVLVNSDFVKETCVFAGVEPQRVHVVYLGVDESFFQSIPEFDQAQVRARAGGPLLYAGGFQPRKGVATLAKAYAALPSPPAIKLVGGVDSALGKLEPTASFLRQSFVQACGIVPRGEMARHMISSPIFVFPSYCEGSARVIFEAMACGCFIITTKNSGSIVRHNEHGFVVPAGDEIALRDAIQAACAAPDMVAETGWKNAQLVKNQYRQKHYGDNVMKVYSNLLQN